MVVCGTVFEAFSEISPDGRWIAFVSDESGQNRGLCPAVSERERGQMENFVGRGVSPLWGPNSRELFYRVSDDSSGSVTIMMTVNDTDPTFNPGTARRLFEGVYREEFP